MASLWEARIAVFVHRCPHGDDGSVEVSIRKGWFSRRELRTESRELRRACFPIVAETEDERVAAALEAAGAMLRRPRD